MIQPLLQLIAPDDCLECGREGSLWCEWCRLEFEPLPSRCFKCHTLTQDYSVCDTCRRNLTLTNVFVATEYSLAAKKLVKALKFNSSRQAALPIARTIAENLPYFDRDTLVVNVPTAPARIRERSFDHTAQIAKEISKQANLNFSKVLVKTNNNRQVGSSKKLRQELAKDSYRLKSTADIVGRKILLIDDVVTTGASLASATKALRQAGAKKVFCAVFAYTK